MNGSWQRREIAGKGADVYSWPNGRRPLYGVIYLHSVGQETLAGNEVFTGLFEELGLVCVCPHGGQSWWSDRLGSDFDPDVTAERWLIDQVVPFFEQAWGLAPPAIGLLGISMGGQGALRLAFKHPRIFPVVASISAALEYHQYYGFGYSLDEMYDSKEQARQDTAILHVHPGQYPPHIYFCIDPWDADWWRGNDRLHEKLSALGIAHTCDLTTKGGGHSWEYFNAMGERAVRFVHSGLVEMSRRLL